jgi:hypothetical protein
MADIDPARKTGSASLHEEHADTVPEKGLGLGHQAADDETAAYTAGSPVEIDKATNRRLFWQINKRILVCMLGVCSSSFLLGPIFFEIFSDASRHTFANHSTKEP